MSRPASLLVVDDHEPNRDALSRRLARQGYGVTTAEGGPAALALLGSRHYDLVLLDVQMPGMTRLEVLRQLRATAASTKASTGSCIATGRSGGCSAGARPSGMLKDRSPAWPDRSPTSQMRRWSTH